MLRSVGFLFTLLSTHYLSASINQENDAKYLKYQHILQIGNDSVKCTQLIQYADRVADSLNDFDFALLIFEKVNTLLQQKNYPTLKVNLYYKWGYTEYLKGNYDTADKLYLKALSYKFLDKKKALKADILNKAGVNLQDLMVYKRAMLYYNESLELYTGLNDERGKAMVYINMANIFVETGNLPESDKFFDMAGEIFLEKNLIEKYSVVLGNKAIVKWRLGKFAEAKELFLKAAHLDLKEIKNANHFIIAYFNLGLIYSELKRWDSCFYYLCRGKEIADSLHISDQLDGTFYYDLGYCYVQKGEIKKGIQYYKRALAIKTGIPDYRVLYDNIADLYFNVKQYDTAFFYKNLSMKMIDSIYKSELKEHISFENKRIELLEKDYQNQIKVKEQEQNVNDLKKRNYLLISVSIILFALVLLTLLYFNQYKLRQKKENLQSELDFLKAQLNPHFLFNSINNIYVLLDENKEKASDILLKFSDLVRYQLYECNVSSILLSKELKFLENYIEFEELRYSNKIKVDSNLGDLNPKNLQVAPLILQPFIENAFKHTPKYKNCSSIIDIRASLNENELLFEVKNTKDEKEVSGLPGGIGLENVKKRLALLYAGKHELKMIISDSYFGISLKLKLHND
jgi:tetratricopeptide (TPR) repeat protein